MTVSQIEKKKRKVALHDLMGLILVGPPGAFPTKPSTLEALLKLTVDRLAKYEPKTAAALLHCAAYYRRLELAAHAAADDQPSGSGRATKGPLSDRTYCCAHMPAHTVILWEHLPSEISEGNGYVNIYPP
jgi:hypothetical protein